MTNTIMLTELIKTLGLKRKFIAEKLGIIPYSLALKMNNKNEFKTSEISILCDILAINSLEQKDKLFFVH